MSGGFQRAPEALCDELAVGGERASRASVRLGPVDETYGGAGEPKGGISGGDGSKAGDACSRPPGGDPQEDTGRPMLNRGRRSSEGARSRTSFLCSPPLPGDTVRRPTAVAAPVARFLEYLWSALEVKTKQGCTEKKNAERGERVGGPKRGVGNRRA